MLHSSPQPLSKITILKLSRTRLNKSSPRPQSVSPLAGVGVGGGHRGAMDHNNLLAAWPVVGPGVAGAVFGAGWWFWVDAVVCSAAAVPFLHYLPGTYARGARSPQASSLPSRLPSLRASRNLGVFNRSCPLGSCFVRVLRLVRGAHVQLRQPGGHRRRLLLALRRLRVEVRLKFSNLSV